MVQDNMARCCTLPSNILWWEGSLHWLRRLLSASSTGGAAGTSATLPTHAGGLEQLKVAELMNMACGKRGCQFVVNTGEGTRAPAWQMSKRVAGHKSLPTATRRCRWPVAHLRPINAPCLCR